MAIAAIEDIRGQVHHGLRTLAMRSSQQVNEHEPSGFHRLDAVFGAELAETGELRLEEVVVGARLLRRYRQQLEQQMALQEEEAIIEWAVAQDETLSDKEVTLALELAREPDASPGEQTEEGKEPQEKAPVAKRVYLQRGRLFIEFPYDRAKVNALQPLKESVEDWAYNRYNRQEWSFPEAAAVSVYEVIRSFQGFAYSPEAVALIKHAYRKEALLAAVQVVDQRWRELAQYAALEAAQPYLDGAPTANGQRLFRHQREAVQRMIEAQRFILAHHMGLGKTRSALIAAQAYDLPIWVIAPAGTLINWQREAAAAGARITLHSWAKLPEPPQDLDYVLIVDEAHFAQGGEETIRGKGFLRLADVLTPM